LREEELTQRKANRQAMMKERLALMEQMSIYNAALQPPAPAPCAGIAAGAQAPAEMMAGMSLHDHSVSAPAAGYTDASQLDDL